MRRAQALSTPTSEARGKLAVFVPGLRGGVDEATKYIFDNDAGLATRSGPAKVIEPPDNPPFTNAAFTDVRIFRTRGRYALFAPLRFTAVLVSVAISGLRGTIGGAHINVSSKGSAIRKALVARLLTALGVDYVVQIHGGRFEQFWTSLPRVMQFLLRPLFSNAACILVLGEPFTHLATRHLGVSSDRVRVVPNGVDIPSQPCTPNAAVPTVVFAGRLDANKNHEGLLRALQRCADLPWTAVFAGDGENRRAKRLVTELGLDNRVSIQSWTSRTDVSSIFQQGSVFVLPSHVEALALSLLEAMSHGLACISTDVGAHSDLVTDNQNGLVIEPGSVDELSRALRQILSEAELRERLGASARATVKDSFSVESVRARLESIYAEYLPALRFSSADRTQAQTSSSSLTSTSATSTSERSSVTAKDAPAEDTADKNMARGKTALPPSPRPPPGQSNAGRTHGHQTA